MYTKKNARVTFKSNRRSGFKRNNNFSNGRVRNKGNVTQQYNKYLKLAKEAFTSGDRIQSEYYYQFTDHYYRLMVDLGINIDESQINLDGKTNSSLDNQETLSTNEQETNKENEQETNKDDNNTQKSTNTDVDEEDDSVESIESIPFIAEPAKKKKVKESK